MASIAILRHSRCYTRSVQNVPQVMWEALWPKIGHGDEQQFVSIDYTSAHRRQESGDETMNECPNTCGNKVVAYPSTPVISSSRGVDHQ